MVQSWFGIAKVIRLLSYTITVCLFWNVFLSVVSIANNSSLAAAHSAAKSPQRKKENKKEDVLHLSGKEDVLQLARKEDVLHLSAEKKRHLPSWG